MMVLPRDLELSLDAPESNVDRLYSFTSSSDASTSSFISIGDRGGLLGWKKDEWRKQAVGVVGGEI
jgi:hypothetical protein